MKLLHDTFRYQGRMMAQYVYEFPAVAVGNYVQYDDRDFTTLVKVDTVKMDEAYQDVILLGYYCCSEDDWEDNAKERAVIRLNPSDSVWVFEKWVFDYPPTTDEILGVGGK